MTHRLLCDTSSLTYRAFFALPSSITDPQGNPVNAVRGVLDMTAELVRAHAPDEVVHVLDDDWRPADRVAAYPGYKAARAPDPEGLPPQFDLLQEVLDAFGLPTVVAPGWEADDAIAVLCDAVGPDDRVDVVTGDRDLIQLVRDPQVRVLFTVRGVTELTRFDERAVEAKYGVPASRYVDFATLRGDPSDGLPGIPGVGDKTARTLVTRYPTLDDLLADAGAQTPRLARALAGAGGYVAAMRAVVPVRSDVPVRWKRPSADPERLEALAAAHRLDGPVTRLRQALESGRR